MEAPYEPTGALTSHVLTHGSMGLDIVEFILAVEAAFGMDIADADAATIATPCDLIAYLRARLPVAEEAPCLTQQAFYQVRDRLVSQTGVSRAGARPSTSLEALLPGVTRRQGWRAWGHTLGAEHWGPLPGTRWFDCLSRAETPTLGAVARHLAVWAPAAVKRSHGWTDREIERCVIALIEAELGVDMTRYSLNAAFVRDMGVD